MPVEPHRLTGFLLFGEATMASRGPLVLPAGEVRDIEDAARAASKAVAHMRHQPDHSTWPCGHRRSTQCRADRCTLIVPFQRG